MVYTSCKKMLNNCRKAAAAFKKQIPDLWEHMRMILYSIPNEKVNKIFAILEKTEK